MAYVLHSWLWYIATDTAKQIKEPHQPQPEQEGSPKWYQEAEDPEAPFHEGSWSKVQAKPQIRSAVRKHCRKRHSLLQITDVVIAELRKYWGRHERQRHKRRLRHSRIYSYCLHSRFEGDDEADVHGLSSILKQAAWHFALDEAEL